MMMRFPQVSRNEIRRNLFLFSPHFQNVFKLVGPMVQIENTGVSKSAGNLYMTLSACLNPTAMTRMNKALKFEKIDKSFCSTSRSRSSKNLHRVNWEGNSSQSRCKLPKS